MGGVVMLLQLTMHRIVNLPPLHYSAGRISKKIYMAAPSAQQYIESNLLSCKQAKPKWSVRSGGCIDAHYPKEIVTANNNQLETNRLILDCVWERKIAFTFDFVFRDSLVLEFD